MVELTLPRNSRMVEGKVWPKPQGAKRLTEFRIYRYDPDGENNPRIDTAMRAARWCLTALSGSNRRLIRR
jgi:hypothetical protein